MAGGPNSTAAELHCRLFRYMTQLQMAIGHCADRQCTIDPAHIQHSRAIGLVGHVKHAVVSGLGEDDDLAYTLFLCLDHTTEAVEGRIVNHEVFKDTADCSH